MAKKVIRFSLDPSSIDKAMREIKHYQAEIKRKTETLRERVATLIAWKASQGFSSALADDIMQGEKRFGNGDVQVDERDNLTVVLWRDAHL